MTDKKEFLTNIDDIFANHVQEEMNILECAIKVRKERESYGWTQQNLEIPFPYTFQTKPNYVVLLISDFVDTIPSTQALIKQMYLTFNQQLQDQGLIDHEQTHQGGPRLKRKRRWLKSNCDQLKVTFYPRKQKYERYQQTFKGRNRFSKTDPNATFMRIPILWCPFLTPVLY